jgi:hypothetical protein
LLAAIDLLPLIEAVGRDQAPAFFEGTPERGFFGYCLRTSVYRAGIDVRVVGPGGY